ncbi:ubiquinone anaerobic biosynthesis protein UbiU [Reinekea marinisedimentorum]|uniref:Ubiquinone biosynthesis protein UbiU n=1 Tax=Reinekea marinisedimentorum TaxID=230495 RepID=A0A4R3HZM5_9GAMM|nr:peptidase U32 family protein [Reinekea marinisedimentorum]TCS38153.1 putative protease [Reinekea marinisedimentorum]
MELVCPAGSLNAFKAAVENGADAVYMGFKDETNARHFAGLNFNDKAAQKALTLAREKGVKLFIAINTFANSENWSKWQQAADYAVELGADAIIAADNAVLEHVAKNHPQQNLHLSVQASATNAGALSFYKRHFNIKRAVLPRVLSLPQVEALADSSPVELEVFAFGSLCVMAEGRCYLSSYLTGESPNTVGACSPAKYVSWENKGDELNARLNGALIDCYSKEENAAYPTLCKGRFKALGKQFNVLEEPTSLNTMDILPRLHSAGVKALKIEGRQRSPAYVGQVVKVWRQAIDHYMANQDAFTVDEKWRSQLLEVSEGSQTTIGAYERDWQ